ncbi:hypothetical protein C0993_011568 [Termitomyces sp. T159_Od127]|nr:hypothetical protein C0993_011568 [Termitomyces sp. T159_Od127]
MPAHECRPYPHHSHLPFAHQPLKALYVFQRLSTTLALVPCWALYYSVVPRSSRPRESWSLRQIINVKFTRRIYKITEVAGVTWETRDPQSEPPAKSLKETRFEWAEPLPKDLRTGILAGVADFTRVGCYIWPKETSPQLVGDSKDIPIIGIFMHGGGYCHMSAHESSRTSRIPRKLLKKGYMSEIYSVEYRLLQHASFPAALQDAATVYAHVVQRYQDHERFKIVLIGDSSGGNLVLALTRWLRDEGTLRMPDGLLLLSPSCDISHALPESPSSYVPRPNAKTDYLTDTPEPRALLQRAFLGFTNACTDKEEHERLMQIAHSEYVSPCSPRVFQEWSHSDIANDVDLCTPEDASASTLNVEDSPCRPSHKFGKLFENFPRTLLIVGDAERLVKEVKCLEEAMLRDNVALKAHWMEDAVHDVLIIANGWWDKTVVKKAWEVIGEWTTEFKRN